MEPFFTTFERREFIGLYRRLLSELGSCLEAGDLVAVKSLLRRVVMTDCYARDANGINGLLRNLSTALIATSEIGLRRPVALALILYRPVLKNHVTAEEVTTAFGVEVSRLIELLLRASDLYARNTAVNSENFHRLLFTFAEDVRVILMMIADRLCLMRLGKQLSEESRLRLSTEVSYLYAPLAHRLGLYRIKSEFEDLSLKYTDPAQYDYIKRKLNQTKRSRDAYIAEFITPVREQLQKTGLSFDIKGRTKSIQSICNKLRKQQIEFESVYDLFAIRVILDSPADRERSDCWQVFSIITDMYQPNPNRMKDWISVPKSNGYESLHITVLGPRNRWVEVQIRTRRMDEVAERGLAAHWKYKGVKEERGLDEFMTEVRTMLDTPDMTPSEAMKTFKMNLYQDEIYVFTPAGELLKLCKGATVLDFAFAIHSKLGLRCTSGRVNGKNVSIRHELTSGDTVEVITSASQHPKQDWLSFVSTPRARSKIKQALREESAKQVTYAKELLQRRFKNRKIDPDEGILMRYIRKRGFKTVTDFYLELAADRLDAGQVIDGYLEQERRERETTEHVENRSADQFIAPVTEVDPSPRSDVLVIDKNLTGVEYKLAKCCNPINGDAVFGFVSTGGIKIHRMNCPNAHEMFTRYGYRVLQARWSGKTDAGYSVTLRVIGHDDIGIVTNITSIISKEPDTTLRSIRVDSIDGLFQGDITVLLSNTVALEKLIKKIQNVKGVKQVSRFS